MGELIALYSEFVGENPEVRLLKGEGSNRRYYRLSSPSGSLIGVQGVSKEENEAFLALAEHFSKKKLNTPKVVAVSPDRMSYLQEDLGDVSLFDLLRKDEGGCAGSYSEETISCLKKSVSLLADFQFKAAEGLDFSVCYPLPSFDRRSIQWDLNYFKYCFLKLTRMEFSEVKLEDDFERLTDDLLKYDGETFLYRDFQSRNVMVKEGQPYFIDFQGGRKGPFYYDLASFVWQAKANYPEEVKRVLVEAYLGSLRKYKNVDETEFFETLQLFVLFRQLQVLGAYGFRGLYERKSHFVESIPFAMQNLLDLLEKNDFSRYPYLVGLIEQVAKDYLNSRGEMPDPTKLTVKVFSFSYKKGIPEDSSGNGGGYVFDCRGVHNPGRYEEYKKLTGLDQPVIDFLEKDGEILSFLESIYALADAHVLRYMERGFTSLMFSCGCTGGQHRSVYSAQHLAEHIAKKFGVRVELCHREQGVAMVLNG